MLGLAWYTTKTNLYNDFIFQRLDGDDDGISPDTDYITLRFNSLVVPSLEDRFSIYDMERKRVNVVIQHQCLSSLQCDSSRQLDYLYFGSRHQSFSEHGPCHSKLRCKCCKSRPLFAICNSIVHRASMERLVSLHLYKAPKKQRDFQKSIGLQRRIRRLLFNIKEKKVKFICILLISDDEPRHCELTSIDIEMQSSVDRERCIQPIHTFLLQINFIRRTKTKSLIESALIQ